MHVHRSVHRTRGTSTTSARIVTLTTITRNHTPWILHCPQHQCWMSGTMATLSTLRSASPPTNSAPCVSGPMGDPRTHVWLMSVANGGKVMPATATVQFFWPSLTQVHPGCAVQEPQSVYCPGRQSQSSPTSEKSFLCGQGLPKPLIGRQAWDE